MRALMKLAGGAHLEEMNPLAFLDQAREYEAGGSVKESFLKIMMVKDRSHPITSLRALELTRWVESGDYRRILNGEYPRREEDQNASFRAEAKAAGESYVNSAKNSGDPLFTKLRGFADDATSAGDRLGQKLYRKWGSQGPDTTQDQNEQDDETA